MGPPANYPDFGGLVKKIARGTGTKLETGEPLERFLGRLHNQGVEVHRLTKDLLTDPRSRPNPIHHAILGLFSTGDPIRIVTTNFDNHLSVAASGGKFSPLEIYSGPALPQASDFSGIVYLHGSVKGPSHRLVLTDRDFGRAYLSEGWATRFLQDLYANYCVLFIGYSHRDIVMNYLTRGMQLPPGKAFALTQDGSQDHWRFLDISPVVYPLNSRGLGRHAALLTALEGWSKITGMGYLDHEQRVKDLLQAGPPLLGSEDDDYLLRIVTSEESIKLFTDNAAGSEWLRWAQERKILDDSLFYSHVPEGRRVVSSVLASWFVKHFVLGDSNRALSIVEACNLPPSDHLLHEIARGLLGAESIPSEQASIWVNMLVSHVPIGSWGRVLDNLLFRLAKRGCYQPALVLLDFVTRPHVQLERTFSEIVDQNAPAVRARSTVSGSAATLTQALTRLVDSADPAVLSEVCMTATRNLHLALQAEAATTPREHYLDPVSFRRSTIEPNSLNAHRYNHDPLVDAARDAWLTLCNKNRSVAVHIRQLWLDSDTPIVQRLGINALREDKRVRPNTKIDTVIKEQWLLTLPLHHEVYTLLRDAYPAADEAWQKKLLDHAKSVTRLKIRSNSQADSDMYWHSLFQLYTWLDSAASGTCRFVKGRLTRLRRRHANFQVSERPDLTHWVDPVSVGDESPLNDAEILARPLPQLASFIGSYTSKSFDGPNRDGLIAAVARLSRNNVDWGLKLGRRLTSSPTGLDVLRRIIQTLSDNELTHSQASALLRILEDLERKKELIETSCEALKNIFTRKPTHTGLLGRAENLGAKLWSQISSKGFTPYAQPGGDWLQRAINHPGGYLSEFFLRIISARRAYSRSKRTHILAKHKRILEKVILGQSDSASTGRIVLASQVHFLFSMDPQWTSLHVLPLFRRRKNLEKARQAWVGYLYWGRWTHDMLEALLPLYSQNFPRVANELGGLRDQFCSHVATICMFSTISRVTRSWLWKFIREVEPQDRKNFAAHVGGVLADLDAKATNSAWTRWLRAYWDDRLNGRPLPLDRAEASEMVAWAPSLSGAFDEVAERVCSISVEFDVDDYIYDRLAESKASETDPQATARFLQHVLSRSDSPIYSFDSLSELLNILKTQPDIASEVEQIENQLASRGFRGSDQSYRSSDNYSET